MTLLTKILMGVSLFLILATGIYASRLKTREREQRREQIRSDSIAAVNDTLKQFQAMDKATIKLLGDSLTIVERSVAQGELTRGVAPGTRTSTLNATGTVKPGLIEITPVLAEGDTIKRFGLVRRQAPFNIDIRGFYQPPSDTLNIQAKVELDPVTLRVDMICRPKAVNGIRSADAYVMAPMWLSITKVETTQRPELCNQAAVQKKQPWFRPQLVAGLGWSWQESHSGPAAFVGVGVGVGFPLLR